MWRRFSGNAKQKSLLSEGPLPFPGDWLELVNDPQTEEQLPALRACVTLSRPFGDDRWVVKIARRLGLATTLRPRGRPRKDEENSNANRKGS